MRGCTVYTVQYTSSYDFYNFISLVYTIRIPKRKCTYGVLIVMFVIVYYLLACYVLYEYTTITVSCVKYLPMTHVIKVMFRLHTFMFSLFSVPEPEFSVS